MQHAYSVEYNNNYFSTAELAKLSLGRFHQKK